MRLATAFLALTIIAGAWSAPVYSDDAATAPKCSYDLQSPEPPTQIEPVMTKCGRKFTRGLTNDVTGVGEIPRQMIAASRNDGSVIGIPTGFFTGVFMTAARIGFGGVETVTFPMPLDGTYDSLLKPDYVWGPFSNAAPAPK